MREPNDDLRGLERLLQSVRFEPRASLGAEIQGRMRRGEAPAPSGGGGFRWVLGVAGRAAAVVIGLAVAWLVTTRPEAARTVDRCCQDLDGGGDADDGLLVVSHGGQQVRRLAVYEDRDRSGSFTPADTVRFERSGTPVLAGPLAFAARTVEFCCLDYDGGGPTDDALVIVGRPDQISMAAIYERREPGALMRLR